jgi:hypothetical protein
MKRQCGQSMTEFAISMTAMALLLLGTITIAGYQEVQRRVAIGAREAAFAGAWAGSRPSMAAMRAAVLPRMDDPSLINAIGHRYVNANNIEVELAADAAPARARAAAQAMVQPLRVAGGFLGGGFDLDVDGLVAGSVNVTISGDAGLPSPFADNQLELRQPFALLGDAWNSGSTRQVRDRTAGLVPTGALAGLGMLWQSLLAPLSLLEPSLSRLCLGIIEPDRIPEDRLSTGRTSLPGRCP